MSIWLVVFAATGTMWCVWQHRAQRNAIDLAGEGLDFTPGWAVGWWFIPFANLFKPLQTVRELWKASHGVDAWRDLTTWSVIGWWWALWLAGNALEYGIGRADNPTSISGFITHDRWGLAALGFEVVAAVLAIVIVRSVVRLQEGAVASPIPATTRLTTASSAERRAAPELPPPPPAG